MADAYSWSSKRSYKTSYVWHDLTADDPMHPASGAEYVLKGSELLRLLPAPAYPRDASAGSSSSSSTSSCQAGNEKKMPTAAISRAHGRRKNWSSFDLDEYRVAAAHSGTGADAATQTGERRGRHRGPEPSPPQEPPTELGADEISLPPSSSSHDTLETLIKNDAPVAAASNTVAARREEDDVGLAQQGVIAGGRMRVSAVLMQLISCGSQAGRRSGRSEAHRAVPTRAVGPEQQHSGGRLLGEHQRRRRHRAGVLQRQPGGDQEDGERRACRPRRRAGRTEAVISTHLL